MRTYIFILTGIMVAGISASCGNNMNSRLEKLKKKQAGLEEQIRSIENQMGTTKDSLDPGKFRLVGITEVIPGPFDHYIKVQGKLDGDQNTAVFAEVPGTVITVNAEVGQKVTKGQVLARMDDSQYSKQLENLKTQYRFAADMFEKQKRLWDQKIGSEVQFLQAKTTKESLEQQISVMEDQIGKFKIKSPAAGTIAESNIRPGTVVSPNPNLPAFRIVGFRELKVTAEVSEAYAAKVKKGDKVMIQFPDINQEIESTVSFASSYIDPVNRVFMIESRIDQDVPGMKANMVSIVRINDYHSDSSFRLPMNVVMTDLNGSYVYIAREKDNFYGAFKQPVVIGNIYNGVAEITKGLNSGDKVITNGFQELVDGEYVRLEKPSEAYVGK